MKLRILGNKIRLRLTQQEVSRLAGGQEVIEKTVFPGGETLQYAVYPSEESAVMEAAYRDHRIEITIPSKELSGWETDNREGIYRQGEDFDISVEKDFKCLHKRPGEDETDNFPNPLEESRQ